MENNTSKTTDLIDKHFRVFNEPGTRLAAFSYYMATGTVNGTFLCALNDLMADYAKQQLSDLQVENERLKEQLKKIIGAVASDLYEVLNEIRNASELLQSKP